MTSNALPQPSKEEQTLSDHVTSLIRAEIQNKGPISFCRFMELALYAPHYGYYQNNLVKFGKRGDFVTAPLISPLFSRCLARQCQEILNNLNKEGDILEIGAGQGVMAFTLLKELAEKNALPRHYYILEISPHLQNIQRQLFLKEAPELLNKIIWLDQFPLALEGVILANEVLDAMPVTQFLVENSQLKEYFVDWNNNAFQWCFKKPQNDALIAIIKKWNLNFSHAYQSEINLNLISAINKMATALKKGVIIIIDYGFPRHEYYHPERNQGTLMCHYHNLAHTNPLIFPGIQDITAHVDFTSVAEIAIKNNLNVSGFTHQAAFLLSLGITDFIAEETNIINQYELTQQIKLLSLPMEMGELFKVIALTKQYSFDLLGFQYLNQLSRVL